MSERRHHLAFAAGLVSALTAFPVQAQLVTSHPADSVDAARFDSLRTAYHVALEVQRRSDSARAVARASAAGDVLDSVPVGPFLVVAPPPVLAHAERELRAAWRVVAPLADGLVLPPRVFVVARGRDAEIMQQLSRRPGHERVWLFRNPLARGAGPSARRAVGGALVRALPDDVAAWLAGAAPGATDLAAVYREMATAPSRAAQRCHEGDAAACVDALGLRDPGPEWQRWYTPAQLRDIVHARQPRRGGSTPDAAACLAGSTAHCIAALRAAGGAPPPLSAEARASLLEHVARTRPGSLAALAGLQHGTVAQRLARVADAPLASVVAEWRSDVVAHRPRAHAGLPVTLLATMFWMAVLLGLAVRSTRWRLG